jgi:hypothetical protein
MNLSLDEVEKTKSSCGAVVTRMVGVRRSERQVCERDRRVREGNEGPETERRGDEDVQIMYR